ncbi:MAG: hypothetical protein WCZ23_02790 [Rhodospirillaceae bacterium]
MAEKTLTVQVPRALHDRLVAVASRTKNSVEATAADALLEYVERWEDHLHACDALDAGTDGRAMLHVVNE